MLGEFVAALWVLVVGGVAAGVVGIVRRRLSRSDAPAHPDASERHDPVFPHTAPGRWLPWAAWVAVVQCAAILVAIGAPAVADRAGAAVGVACFLIVVGVALRHATSSEGFGE